MPTRNKSPTFYEYIYDRLRERYINEKEVRRVEAEKFIGRCYNIPKSLRNIILKEMEHEGWIKLKSDSIELLSPQKNPTNKISKIQKQLGIW